MPFTPSHIAAVLPFAGTGLFPAALVAGSMVPDLFFYLPGGPSRAFTHSPLGALAVDVPLALVLFVLWRVVLLRPVIDLAPRWVRSRTATMSRNGLRPCGWSWPRVALVAVASVLLGIATHVVWDAFTHDGWTVEALPALGLMLGPLPLYDWLQHVSTVAGAAVLVAWVAAWARRTPTARQVPTRLPPPARRLAWLLVLGAGAATAIGVTVGGVAAGESGLESLVFDTVTSAIGAAAFALLVVSLAWWRRATPVGAEG